MPAHPIFSLLQFSKKDRSEQIFQIFVRFYLIIHLFGLQILFNRICRPVHWTVTVHSVPVTNKIPCKNCNMNKFVMQMDFYLLALRFLTDLAVNAKSYLNSNIGRAYAVYATNFLIMRVHKKTPKHNTLRSLSCCL